MRFCRLQSARILFCTFCLLALSLPAAAQSDPDDDAEEDYSLETSFKFYPSPLWSQTTGFAAGVGYEIENLFMPRGRLLATAKPGQHLGRYTLTYFARDAYSDPLYGLANVYYETTGRQWYYGVGPTSSHDDRLGIEKEMIEAEVRVGLQPLGRIFTVQPVVRYVRHDVKDFRSFDDGAFIRLSEESRRSLSAVLGMLPGSSERQEGIAYGIAAGVDFRDRPRRTRRGLLLQGSVQRYAFSEPEGLEYDQYEIYAYGYVPLRGGALGLRVITKLTEAAGDLVIPFYLLPTLHGRALPGYSWNRFFGNDLFVATAEAAVPLFQLLNFAATDLIFSVGAGNVYDDLFEQFEPALTFETDLPEDDTYPLRPSASVGLELESLSRHGWDLRILLGWGTEGVRLIKFGFVHDMRDIELGKR